MATLIENCRKIENVFAKIKTAIQNKGIEVANGTSVTRYAGLIDGIVSGGGDIAELIQYKSYRRGNMDTIVEQKHGMGTFTVIGTAKDDTTIID